MLVHQLENFGAGACVTIVSGHDVPSLGRGYTPQSAIGHPDPAQLNSCQVPGTLPVTGNYSMYIISTSSN